MTEEPKGKIKMTTGLKILVVIAGLVLLLLTYLVKVEKLGNEPFLAVIAILVMGVVLWLNAIAFRGWKSLPFHSKAKLVVDTFFALALTAVTIRAILNSN